MEVDYVNEMRALHYANCSSYVKSVAQGILKSTPGLSADEAVVAAESFADILKRKVNE